MARVRIFGTLLTISWWRMNAHLGCWCSARGRCSSFFPLLFKKWYYIIIILYFTPYSFSSPREMSAYNVGTRCSVTFPLYTQEIERVVRAQVQRQVSCSYFVKDSSRVCSVWRSARQSSIRSVWTSFNNVRGFRARCSSFWIISKLYSEGRGKNGKARGEVQQRKKVSSRKR